MSMAGARCHGVCHVSDVSLLSMSVMPVSGSGKFLSPYTSTLVLDCVSLKKPSLLFLVERLSSFTEVNVDYGT